MEEFISHLDSDTYKIKPNTFKLIKHMNKDIKNQKIQGDQKSLCNEKLSAIEQSPHN
jgi:hypothetical protein